MVNIYIYIYIYKIFKNFKELHTLPLIEIHNTEYASKTIGHYTRTNWMCFTNCSYLRHRRGLCDHHFWVVSLSLRPPFRLSVPLTVWLPVDLSVGLPVCLLITLGKDVWMPLISMIVSKRQRNNYFTLLNYARRRLALSQRFLSTE